jgi:hypothetical protein
MARIATSIEESKRLLELGIDPNTADMSYDWIGGKVYDLCLAPCVNEMDIPAWSLGALLDICPYDRDVYFDRNRYGIWIDTELTTMPFDGDYIGAVVKTIELLVNEGYIKGKENQE